MAVLSHLSDILSLMDFILGGLKGIGNDQKRYCAVWKNRKSDCGIPAPCTTLQPFFTPLQLCNL
jgi:hypothetical protein